MYIVTLYSAPTEEEKNIRITDVEYMGLISLLKTAGKFISINGRPPVAVSNIAGFFKEKNSQALDRHYNPLQIEEPKTYVKPETRAKVDSYMKKFTNKFIHDES
jgi:hypothetical protein